MPHSTILCVDDDALLLDFIVLYLAKCLAEGSVVLKAASGMEALGCVRCRKVDLVVLDLGLPDMSGFMVAAELKAISPGCRILLLSGNLTETAANRLRYTPVQGCLLKSSVCSTEVRHAVQEIAAGRSYFSDAVLAIMAKARREADHFSKILSDREIEILPYLGYGWSNDRIARCTRISAATVRTHHQNILMKLNLHGREELMRWAMKKGFVDFRYEPVDPSPAVGEDGPIDWSV